MAQSSSTKPSPSRPSHLSIRIDHSQTPEGSAPAASPLKTPVDGAFHALHLSDSGAIRRSDTNDSLVALVNRSPEMSYLGDLEQLPSPGLANESSAHLLARRRSSIRRHDLNARSLPNSPSPAEPGHKEGPLRPGSPLTGGAKRRFPSSKALTHLINEERGRHASLQLTEPPLASLEIPPIRRERSQSTVHRLDPDMLKSFQQAAISTATSVDDVAGQLHLQSTQQVYELAYEGESVMRRFRALRTLGGGTFSRVELVEDEVAQQVAALKVVEFLSKEDVDPARLFTTVKREIDILQKTRHPLIVSLLGHRLMGERALLLLPFHPGGDLYSLASTHKVALTRADFVRRIMAELVIAVAHLHEQNIVHRDLKLENVLMRIPQQDILAMLASGESLPSPMIALTDFGLARFIDPAAPELSTRCGSEDYAAPEIIMGQRYDGRHTDAWALGIIFYSLLEGRLPFDVIPGLEHRMKGKVLHRICRIEWRWVTLKHAGEYDCIWDGAKRIVSNLLRSRTKRWSVNMLLEDEWLKDEVAEVRAMIEISS